MDITQPLDFPAASFDLINARLLQGFMKREAWLPLLLECRRLLRPGGILRLTEAEVTLSNSRVLDTYASWWVQAPQQTGQAFSGKGHYHLGSSAALKPRLVQAGYMAPKHVAHAIEYSTGTPAHHSMLADLSSVLKLGAPFLIRQGIASQTQIKQLQEQLQALLGQEGFCAYWFLMTLWAHKPTHLS